MINEEHPDRPWVNYLPKEKETVLDRVNKQLSEHGIPEVDMELLGWRMNQLMRNIRKAQAKEAQPSYSGASTGETKPYDPVRDM